MSAKEILRVCTRCDSEKPIEEFYVCSRSLGGRKRICKECMKAQHRSWTSRSRETLRDKWLRLEYGITTEDFERMLAAQGGVCAICKNPESIEGRPLSVDHCHESERVRGLLCTACNQALGLLGDSPELTAAATRYLIDFPVQTDHGAAAQPNGAYTDNAGNEPMAGAFQ